ncbi:bactofilin family protein [Sandaracinus amylolyticus]|uniref:bactofilin family protein n=1 Tax=Sandaracinus amylolyticus TaxID=927083 RepID=UPI001F2C8D1E|nr:polymer-forming cytoskeletal protein [Sandaracinus amylolyticus]UJR81924.1 Integral membrane protein CcmA [Sandaracinus amylolyticus]
MPAPRDLTGIGELHALLGRGARFEGKLAFEGRVRIDGALKGEILGDGVLVIGDGAEVEANIEVGTLIVRGGVLRGNVLARQLIEIHPEGAVYGDIQAPEIDISKGCVFEGRCTMLPVGRDDEEAETGETAVPDEHG